MQGAVYKEKNEEKEYQNSLPEAVTILRFILLRVREAVKPGLMNAAK